jgi:hypothetical protein
MEHDLPIRVTVLHPPKGVTFAMQRGKDELLPPSKVSAESLVFDLSVRVSQRKGGGAPNILGPYAQGKPDDRFLYVNSGTLAGQENTPWTRRAKVKTGGISWKLVEQILATPGSVLEARIDGVAKDGGPCCATVPIVHGGWTISPAKPPKRGK